MWKSSSFLLILSLIVVKTLLFTVIISPWQGPDEPFHFKMGYILADPSTDIQKLDADMVRSLQQYRFQEYTDYTQKESEIPGFDDDKLRGYYATLAFLFRPFSDLSMTGKMFLGRLFSAVCYLAIVLLVCRISRRIFTDTGGYWVSIAAVSFVGFQPQYSFFSITLNSDSVISLLLTVILFCVVHIASRWQEASGPGMRKYWPWLVAVLAVFVGLLAKRTGFVGFLLFVASIIVVNCGEKKSLMKAGAVATALLAPLIFLMAFSGSPQRRDKTCFNKFSISFGGVPGDIEMSFQAFDIDWDGEVAVLLNETEIAEVKRTKDNTWSPTCVLNLPDKLVSDKGPNIVTFDNLHNPPYAYDWGVRNVRIGNILKVERPHGNIPPSRMFEGVTEVRKILPGAAPPILAKWTSSIGRTIRQGVTKLSDMSDIPSYLFVRFILVQFVSFWFSLGWMIYKMSLGWYVLFSLITLLSLVGLIRLIYARFRNRGFAFVNLRVVSLLILLFVLSQAATVIAYGPSPDGSMSDAMGRCRFMEIGAVSILIPLGLWAISPARKRDMVMKSFVCFMIFLNMVSVLKYIIPIFYL
jgi:hypothetical protein